MKGYYEEKLAADRLKKCYAVASPRIRQYLQAEMNHVLSEIKPGDRVLDLGCGYGRTLPPLCEQAGLVTGIDTSYGSLRQAFNVIRAYPNGSLALMNAVQLGFPDKSFDVVACIQNGLSAFHVEQDALVRECIRVVKPGGVILFSSYAEKFWNHRLQWFEAQSQAGLLGKIDYGKTKNGNIVCHDGFTATTITPGRFRELTDIPGIDSRIVEVDESSLFCHVTRR